jgi:putative FmdB family regulatory protein
MPIYEYRCEKGHNFEVMQRMSDDALTECSICGAPVQRVFHPVAIHFKGSGFYNTDYGKRKRGAAAKEDGGSKSESSSSSSSSSDSGSSSSSSDSSSKSESKTDSKPSSSAGTKSSD